MGVLCSFARLPGGQLDRLLADLDAAEALFSAIRGVRGAVADSTYEMTDIDKAHDAIHFALDPARRSGHMGESTGGLGGRLVYGTHPCLETWPEEFYYDYGVAGYSRPDEVRALVAEMALVDFEAALAKVAPALAVGEERGDVYVFGNEGYVRNNYAVLRRFYESAAANGEAVISFVL